MVNRAFSLFGDGAVCGSRLTASTTSYAPPRWCAAAARWLAWQNSQSFREETKAAIISRSPLVSVPGPRSSTSASSRIGLAVSGRYANALVIPGRPSGRAMCGIGLSRTRKTDSTDG